MRRLKSASAQYAKLFPALPSLPKILSLLSTSPRPYSTLIPSSDHKAAYLDILAWLLRGGWVMQLRTFAWVRVPSHVRSAVARQIEKEAQNGLECSSDPISPITKSIAHTGPNIRTVPDPGEPDVPTGQLSPPSSSPGASSLSSARTAIALDIPAESSALPPVLILHPTKASGIESRYLAAIAAEMAGCDPLDGRDEREKRKAGPGCQRFEGSMGEMLDLFQWGACAREDCR